MPRPLDPAVRRTLIEQAAALLTSHEPVTLRGVAAAAGTSTMAVYTHFGGMPGLWRAVRQEAFARLGERLATLTPGPDALADLTAVGVAYAANARANPDLYLAMFDNRHGLDDPAAADRAFEVLVAAVRRAREESALPAAGEPRHAATQLWAMTHGAVMLALTEAVPAEHLPALLTDMWAAAYAGFGADPGAARAALGDRWGQAGGLV
jgi:AcrR family transcriptional regulator